MRWSLLSAISYSLLGAGLFAAELDPVKLPNVKQALEAAKKETQKNWKAYDEANDKVVEETQKKLVAEVNRLKAADLLDEAAALKKLAADAEGIKRLIVAPTPVAPALAELDGVAMPIDNAGDKGWVPLQPGVGVQALMVYPAIMFPDKNTLKQHLDGTLQKKLAGRVAPRDPQGLYLVPNQPLAKFSALCAIRANNPTALTVKATGNGSYGQTKVIMTVNNVPVADGQQITIPKGGSLIHVGIEVYAGKCNANETWFRLDLEAEPGKVEVFIP